MPESTSNPRVVLITGANGGLGRAVTNTFLKAGATVFGVSRTIVDNEFPDQHFTGLSATVATGAEARAIVGAVIQQKGRIDGLVHLIGGFDGGQTVADTSDSSLEKMLDANLRSAFYMIRAALPQMKAQGGGRIVAIGSKSAVEPAPMAGAYAASKAALVSLVRTVALENKHEAITANVVSPGTMDTLANREAMPGADFNMWVSPDQVAGLLTYLVLGDSTHINGAVIPVYGPEA